MKKLNPKSIEDILSLTPLQEGMLFHYLQEPQGNLYFEQLSLGISGAIDVQVFEKTWNFVIQANEMLRTVFRWEKLEKPSQIILKKHACQMRFYDFLDMDDGQKKTVLSQIKTGDRDKGFDLTRVPFRVTLCKLTEREYEMIISNHHILYDGWSNGIILKEFFNAYHVLSKGEQTLALSAKPSLKEYIKWLQSRDRNKQEQYWNNYLAGFETPTELPIKRKEEDITGTGDYSLVLGEDIQSKLNIFIKNNRVTLASLFYTAWGILLQKYCNSEDIVFGTTVSGRSADVKGIEDMVGLFINTIPLRINSYPDETIIDAVFRIDQVLWEREKFENTPLVDIRSYSRIGGSASLFDTIIVIENYPLDNHLVPGGSPLSIYSHSMIGTTYYDLSIGIMSFKEIEIKFIFKQELFDKDAIENLAGHFKGIFQNMIESPGMALSQLEIISCEEKNRILYEFNNTVVEYLNDKTIHRLFEEQAERTPDHTALVGEASEIQLSYGLLNEKSNRLARYLRRKGVKSDNIVGIIIGPGIEMITSIFSVLKAGGVYLPMDPTYPGDRIQFMLEDSGAKFLLITAGVMENFAFTALQGLQADEPGQEQRCHVTPRRNQITDLDAQPMVDRTTVNYDKYSRYIGIGMVKQTISLQATRGCPYQCAYCHKIWPKNHVFRSAENIFAEVRHYYDLGVRRFVFIDDVFNLNRENSRDFFQLLIDRCPGVRLFFPNGVRGDILTREYIDLMVRAGTVSMALALETASPRLQKLIGKNLNVERLRENLEYLCQQYPQVILDLFTMHGFPTETEQEAIQTLDFIKGLHWIDFPFVHILKIYPNTGMAEIARKNGISARAIARSTNLTYHELPDTLPFDKQFTARYQAEFLNRYFLLKERLLHVLPYQMKLLTEDELVQKYKSYLPIEIKDFAGFLEFAGIKENELGAAELSYNRPDTITDLDRRIKQARSTGGMTPAVPSDDALKVLLLDLSLFLSGDKENILYNLVEPPLGLMYLLTALNQQLGGKINGRIAKSRIDFDSYEELKELLEEFRPGIIGIRALTLYKHFFHRVAAMIRGWGIDVPIIAGGPYATSEYAAILRDRNIDLVVLGEGEVTFCHLVSEILNNNGKLPGDAVLETIPGIAYIPRKNIPMYTYARDIIMMDTIEPEPAKEAKGNPPCINKSSDGAYVIFTSGTTGKPKGVLVEHRNLISLMKAGSDLFGYNCRDVWSMFHSFCFDFSVWEMYGALLYGGRLIVIPKMIVRDPGQFLHVLLNQKVTILNQTPSAFYNLIDEALKNQSNRLCLRYIIFGGEALKPARLKGWREKYPGIKLVNMFGITETCVHVTYKEIGEREIEGDISNIGKPIPTLNTYIMSRHQKLMPPGTSGELYVGGEGVARGYLNRPELTAEKFQVNRFYKSYKTYIFYKSGDLARMNSDGEMVYLGRIDQQVQLRGYRIELGEIESRLLEHKGIKAAVVIDQNISGDLYLCAYIVPQTGVNAIDLEAAALREFLARQLPDYMIPSYIVQLEEIPLTSHGKIDRKGLPEPEINIKNSYHSTLSETEQKLAGIWQDVLRLKKVSSEDDFFDVGGDSIKAVRLVSRINERLKSNLKLVDIYSHKNIAELAELVDREENEAIKQLNKKVTANLEELKQRIFAQVVEQGKWNLAEIEDVYPMSEIEKGMVFSYMKYAGMGIYHDQNVYLLYYKNFDIELVKKVMTLLTMKNEILRTVFNLDEFEEPVQMVFKEPKLDFGSTDLTGLPQDKQFELLETWLSEDRKKPFESSQILWRMHIFTLGKDWVCLMLVAHHAILDGWSTVTLMTEFYITYNKLKDNPQYVLPRLQSSYKDMIIREKVEKENERTRRYWQEELRDYTRLEFSETTKGKAEMALMKIYKYNGGEELLARARQAAALRNTDIKNLCFSAYAYMMRMFSYENDMVLGCVTHTRTEGPDGDKVLGCFLNTVPVRLKIPTPLSWHEYVVMVERKMMEVKKHERLSLFEIALLLDEKNKDRNPFFDTLLNFTDFHLYRELDTDENIRITENNKQNFPTVELHQDTNTLFDFEVDITTGSLLIQPKYNVQVISDYVIKKCCIYFVNILEKYINEPDSIAHRDDILPLTEKEDLLRHFNDTRAAYSREKTMVLLFEEQVLKTQDNTAVIGGNGIGHITYRELNEKANQLGNGLRKMEVGKADFVGVVMERCLEMVTAVMGILKAGGAYVPLEPHLPDRRIEKILESLSTKCVITDSKNRPRFESMSSSLKNLNHIISLDKVGYRKFRNNSRKNPVPLSGPGDIAYIIYTSGSTGTPKGVVETHQPVVNVIEWVNKTFAVGKEDKLLFVASLGFDLSVYDIFGILASGASLRTVETKDMKEPLRLLDIMIKEGITFWDSAPAALQQLVPFFNEIKKTGAITKLRLVFLSGDWIPVSMPDAVKDTFKEVRIISLGGATEATIWSNYYPIGDVNPNWLSIPYGKPIQNAEYYILDTDLNLCPIHIAGDLYIGGECLAKEYKNDPVLTAAKFIDNPFCASGQGEKIYKTGDIARWLEDGNMQFLGRKDQQVKIRGYRIELGEIENHLSSFPGIREAIAIDRKDSNGNKYICAYYTIKKAGEKIAREELLAHLSKELPEYMMPAHFILIDQIPVTANGKLDRKSLPEPEFKAEDTYRAPENELQKKILAIWQEVLFRHNEVQVQIGIDDDFFELGGHSLNATIVIAKIHKMANVKVPLTEMFKCPTIRGLAEVIEKSSKEIYTGIKLAEKKDYYSLSSSQRRLYVLQQISPESTVYNLPIFLQLEGILDKERIKETMQKLLERHESLRTSFSMRNDEPIQRIPNEVEFEIEYKDLAADKLWQQGQTQTSLMNFIRPFDLFKVPLLRVALLKENEKRHILMVDIHHIISDGASIGILVKDFIDLYQRKNLQRLTVQYKDFSEWLDNEKQKELIKQQENFWLNEFAEEIVPIELPTDYMRPKIQSFDGDSIHFEIDDETTKVLKKLILEVDVTMYMILLAFYNIFLAKVSNQEDIVVGSIIAGRRHADLERIIGMFVNTLSLRNYPAGDKTFSDFLQEIKKKTLNAFENQDYQFEDLVEKIVIERDTSRNPLFDVMFVLQNIEIPGIEIPGLMVQPYEYDNKTAKFDLSLTALEEENKILFTFEYSTKLFKEETIQRFITYFKNILNGAILNKDRKISGFEILTEAEKSRILFEFNDTAVEYPRDKTIDQLFTEQMCNTPDYVAIVEPVQLTYRQLNDQSDRLAGLLIKKGVMPENIVGIMMERSVEMIISIIGILKSGGAYLPIDPGYPRERIDYMLKDCNAAVLLTYNSQLSIVNCQLSISGCPRRGLHHSSFHIPRNHHSNQLAYVIYTSGSTGRPKGVLVTHQNVVRLVKNTNYIEFFPGYSILQTGAMEFDASTFEVWGTLLNGLKLVLVNKETILSSRELKAALRRYNISTIWMTSPLFNLMLQEDIEIFAGLKNLLVGGDVLSPDHIGRLSSKYPRLNVINGYGPTENTTFSTTCLIQQEYTDNIPIGKPIANSTAYIVDKYNQLQPIGVPGELLVGGDGVARGYLNNPELTADKFKRNVLTNDQCPMTNDYFYSTGDLARWLSDGNLEFLGRIDQQVKIRGFRIEVGEIENQLLKHKHIKEAVVILNEDARKDKNLTAYIVSTEEILESELREYLEEKLPDYMIPSYFVRLEKIPLTPNGKLDRKALPKPGLQAGKCYIAPRDEIERKLIELWAEILSKDQLHISQLQTLIGIDDNFFHLGGHSLKATLLLAKVHKAFNVNIPLPEIFKVPTIRKQAKYIKEAAANMFTDIEFVEEKEYYDLSYIQNRIWLLCQMHPGNSAYHMNGQIEMKYEVDFAIIKKAFQCLLDRHENLRTFFKQVGSQPAQFVKKTVAPILRNIDISTFSDDEKQKQKEILVAGEYAKPFDLTAAPLFRCLLIKNDSHHYTFVFTIHHIISDGASLDILKNEFHQLYEKFKENTNVLPTLDKLTINYKDFSAWYNKRLNDNEFKQEAHTFWLEKIKPGLPPLELPVDFSSRQNDYRGSCFCCFASPAIKESFEKIAKNNNASFFTLLFSALTIFLYHLTKQRDIVCAVISSGREHISLQNVVGCFINIVPIKIDFSIYEDNFPNFLNKINEEVFNALRYQNYPIEIVLDELQIKYPDITFAVNMPGSDEVSKKVELTSFESYHNPRSHEVKFQLELYINEFKNGIQFEWNYQQSVYLPETVEFFANSYLKLLDAIVTNMENNNAQ